MSFHFDWCDVMQQILRMKQVEEFTGLSRYTIYRFMGEGTFPKQIKLGKRAVGWLVDDVNNWLASRAKAA